MINEIKSIALFGGSFDPPHIAHEDIVKELLRFDDIQKVVVMPTFLNPFKSEFYAPSELRLKWLKCIFASYENVEISSYEVDLKRAVPTIESVEYLLGRYEKIYLTIGADNLKSLKRWKNYDQLKNLVTFIVATRDDIEIPLEFIKIDVDDNISSSTLRDQIDITKLNPICSKEIIKFYKEKHG
jgi:nicotinate-nucleotide adenylyltransferase